MMKTLCIGILLVLSCLMGFASDGQQEPPMIYTLHIDGKTMPLTLGKPITLPGKYDQPEVRIDASPTRTFPYGGLSFLYPAHFGWEADINDPDLQSWTLSGNNFTIMYFVFREVTTLEEFTQMLVGKFGKENTQVSETQRTWGTQNLKGSRLEVSLMDAGINMEVFAIPAQSGTRLIAFQDTPPDKHGISSEGKTALQLLADSFQDTAASR